jgi:signal transduction histidine kinase/DNA-binding response OmpR family regulator
VVFDPDDIRDNYLTFPVRIEELAINNGSVAHDVNGIPVEEALRMNNPVRLRYNQNTISFKYANLNYADEKKSNFAYQLSGLHEDFQYVQDQRQVTFINLGPGEYTFNVIASNNDDIWDRKGAEFAFTILNPPWLTWWAYTIYGILLILIFYALRSQVRHELKMKNAIRLERMEKDQQKELTQMKLRFFTNISHEFKTPLSLIIGPLDQIITELHGNSALKAKLSKISASSKRLLELINQLIDFRKIEQDALPLNKTSNDLVETIQKTMGAFDTLALNNEILFTLHTDFESLVINYDRDKIEKILSNILSNAYKFTSPGDKITVRIWQRNIDNVCITISDTGRGIAPEKLAGIFERFGTAFTTDSTTLDGQGSGIGLAYSKKLAELHNGSLQIESKPEQGTKVTIEFPCDREESTLTGTEHKLQESIMDVSESPVNEPTTFETTSEDLGGLTGVPRILVVDDDTELRHYIVSILMDRFKIDEAGDGQSAYNLAMQNDYDLIVSDVMMPNITGIELCNKLKSDINTSHIHVILLTVKSDMDSQIEGYETGADSYITKPFLPKQLIQVITNLLTTRRKIKAYYTSAEEKTEEPLGIHPRDKKFITDATAIIEKNISVEEFGVEVLGKELGLSRTHLFRKFKSLTGKAPNDFIRQIRLTKAARLLKEGNYSISEIAYMVGFKTPANFSTSFKALYRKTPKEYQENI